jgi:uncharacterized membrane protein ArfC
MHNVNYWLLALAFLLGLVLTLAFMLRRVKREVPEYGTGSGSARLTGSAADVKAPKVDGPDVDAPTAVVPKVDAPGGDSEPYGAGSLRLAGGVAAPSGYAIKGNEDSKLYHTTDSPSYKQTIAEVWFRDEPTAERAGFTRWDSGKSQRDKH